MRKNSLALLLFFFVILINTISALNAESDNISNTYKQRLKNETVRVDVTIGGKAASAGTGFFFQSQEDGNRLHILTAYHVIRGATKITVYSTKYSLRDVNVMVWRISGEYDIADLRVDGENDINVQELLPIDLSDPSTIKYEQNKRLVYSAGFPRGYWYLSDFESQLMTEQPVSSKNMETLSTFSGNAGTHFGGTGVFLIPIDSLIYNGSSGSPVLHGQVIIGVVSGSLNEGGAIGWVIPTYYLSKAQMTKKDSDGNVLSWPQLTLLSESDYRRMVYENYEPPSFSYEFQVGYSRWLNPIGQNGQNDELFGIDGLISFEYDTYQMPIDFRFQVGLLLSNFSSSYETLPSIQYSSSNNMTILPILAASSDWYFLGRGLLSPYVGIAAGVSVTESCVYSPSSGFPQLPGFIFPAMQIGIVVNRVIDIGIMGRYLLRIDPGFSFNQYGESESYINTSRQLEVEASFGFRLPF